ncbi:MAG: hypothetical protein Q4F53_05930, partial [Nesterenkonia sp.]|nr:hypothetical protein [Nesterenkonia sp.]
MDDPSRGAVGSGPPGSRADTGRAAWEQERSRGFGAEERTVGIVPVTPDVLGDDDVDPQVLGDGRDYSREDLDAARRDWSDFPSPTASRAAPPVPGTAEGAPSAATPIDPDSPRARRAEAPEPSVRRPGGR